MRCTGSTASSAMSAKPPTDPVAIRGKILVIVTEDWFALSHFKPLLEELKTLAHSVVIATRSSGRLHEIEDIGVQVCQLDMQRGSRNPLSILAVSRDIARLVDDQKPDVVHAIAFQSMVLLSSALRYAKHGPPAVMYHLTGSGYLSTSRSWAVHGLRRLALASLKSSRARLNPWLLAENPDDAASMHRAGVTAEERTTLLPGAGVDLAHFPVLPPPQGAMPRVAFVGRMLHSKGVAVLVEAHQRLWTDGCRLQLALYGSADASAHQAIPQQTLEDWGTRPGIGWHGHVRDIVGVWRQADIAVVPSLGGEGMPRAMLEAAACGRPLVVSEVAGGRHFVQPNVEGLVVPPGDATALAGALQRLAGDAELRARFGAAARERVASHFTEAHVRARVRTAYLDMGASRASDA